MKTWIAFLTAAVVGLLGLTRSACAEDLKVGDKAPNFSLKGSDGKTYQLSDFKGKQAVVIAWFPKAFTGGCTKECKSFRANSDAMKGTKAAYFTASCDDQETNAKFAKSLDLDYPILCDPDKSVAKAYGVLMAQRGLSARWTFYIDKEGVVREIDKMVKTDKAGEDVVATLKKLGLAD